MSNEIDHQWRIQIVALLLICASCTGASEIVAHFVVPRVSKIEARSEAEEYAARHMVPIPTGPKNLLVVGNSLLQSVLRPPLTQQALDLSWRISKFVVEQTDYLDWYYGIAQLLELGSMPDTIAIMLSPRQLLADTVRTSYSSYRLFSAEGALLAGKRARLHPTDISRMLLSHYSAYYGLRAEIRKFAFQRIVPDAIPLMAMMRPERFATQKLTEADVNSKGRQRLEELLAVCRTYRIRCLFLVPPGHPNTSVRSALVALTQRMGMEGATLDAGFGAQNYGRDGEWPVKYFDSDLFHFSDAGAVAYSISLGLALKDVL